MSPPTSVVNAEALEAIRAGRRHAPKRYPLIGFSVVGIFFFGTPALMLIRVGPEIFARVAEQTEAKSRAERGRVPPADSSKHETASPAPATSAPAVERPPTLSEGPLSLGASAALGAQEARDRLPSGSPVAAAPPAVPAQASASERSPAVATLLTSTQNVLHSLKGAGHDVSKIADVTWQGRNALDKVDQLLRTYRETPRDEDAQSRALAFVRQIDEARGFLLQATAELQFAVTATDPMGGSRPFRKADALLDRAEEDLRTASTLALTAP